MLNSLFTMVDSFTQRISFLIIPMSHKHSHKHCMHNYSSAINSLRIDALESDPGLIEEVSDNVLEPDHQEHQGKSIFVNEC